MKKVVCVVMAIMMMCMVVTGCAESVEDYEKRIEATLTEAQKGFDEAIQIGDVDKAQEIINNYQEAYTELEKELYEMADKCRNNPKKYKIVMQKAAELDAARNTTLAEMQLALNKVFFSGYNNSNS